VALSVALSEAVPAQAPEAAEAAEALEAEAEAEAEAEGEGRKSRGPVWDGDRGEWREWE
jgi:hypothetical protein